MLDYLHLNWSRLPGTKVKIYLGWINIEKHWWSDHWSLDQTWVSADTWRPPPPRLFTTESRPLAYCDAIQCTYTFPFGYIEKNIDIFPSFHMKILLIPTYLLYYRRYYYQFISWKLIVDNDGYYSILDHRGPMRETSTGFWLFHNTGRSNEQIIFCYSIHWEVFFADGHVLSFSQSHVLIP